MGHRQFQRRGSVSVCTCLPCCVGVCVVQRRAVCPWSGTLLSSVQSSHMLGIGHLLLGRRSALRHDAWCSFHRSVVAAVSVPVRLCPFPRPFFVGPLHMVWTSLELPRPIASISPLMAMWVLHVSNILAVVAVIGIARSFFTSSRSSRA